MSTESNKALVMREADEIFSQGKLDVYDEILIPDYVIHEPSLPEPIRGIEGAKQFAASYRTAFPDLSVSVEEIIAEGDTVAVRWSGSGTHQGDLNGIAPTGRRVRVTGMSFYRIADGRIAEDWTIYDALGMMQQLGVIPEPSVA